jgi:K+-transporting ATPase ATPase A chain
MARVYAGKPLYGLDRLLGPVERLIYRGCGVRADEESDWKRYALGLLFFNTLGILAVYAMQRVRHLLPLNPAGQGAVAPDLSFNTAVSFATNTNWQAYSGESTLSYLTQMAALTVQNFLSAATGMAVLVALIRGLARRSAGTIGNFWVDLTRSTLYVLLPLSLVLAVALASQGVVQTFGAYRTVPLVQAVKGADGKMVAEQTIAVGPVASQVAIKQLGTNGGGFFGVNSAHPFENPTPLANFLEMLAILLIPAALCYMFGRMVGDRRQGWAVLAAMLVFAIITVFAAGLMVGRTPEYLGKKIEAFEMKMASLVILIPPGLALVGAAVASVAPGGLFNRDGSSRLANPGAHGFSEILYAMSSAGNNNGSAFAGCRRTTRSTTSRRAS